MSPHLLLWVNRTMLPLFIYHPGKVLLSSFADAQDLTRLAILILVIYSNVHAYRDS
jgi:hypothetical protein